MPKGMGYGKHGSGKMTKGTVKNVKKGNTLAPTRKNSMKGAKKASGTGKRGHK